MYAVGTTHVHRAVGMLINADVLIYTQWMTFNATGTYICARFHLLVYPTCLMIDRCSGPHQISSSCSMPQYRVSVKLAGGDHQTLNHVYSIRKTRSTALVRKEQGLILNDTQKLRDSKNDMFVSIDPASA